MLMWVKTENKLESENDTRHFWLYDFKKKITNSHQQPNARHNILACLMCWYFEEKFGRFRFLFPFVVSSFKYHCTQPKPKTAFHLKRWKESKCFVHNEDIKKRHIFINSNDAKFLTTSIGIMWIQNINCLKVINDLIRSFVYAHTDVQPKKKRRTIQLPCTMDDMILFLSRHTPHNIKFAFSTRRFASYYHLFDCGFFLHLIISNFVFGLYLCFSVCSFLLGSSAHLFQNNILSWSKHYGRSLFSHIISLAKLVILYCTSYNRKRCQKYAQIQQLACLLSESIFYECISAGALLVYIFLLSSSPKTKSVGAKWKHTVISLNFNRNFNHFYSLPRPVFLCHSI